MKYVFLFIIAILNLLFHLINYILRFIFTFKINWGDYISSYYYNTQQAKHFNHQDDSRYKYKKIKYLSDEKLFNSLGRWISGNYY